jgi:histidinol-phosphate/aromatic aminotransferase/cobyric acid decarboxylase-like protein
LTRNEILIRERSKDLGPGFARITIGTKKELQAFLRILERGGRLWWAQGGPVSG